MRGIKGLVTETSVLDADEGIRYVCTREMFLKAEGRSIPSCHFVVFAGLFF
jgi:hypothetical protein